MYHTKVTSIYKDIYMQQLYIVSASHVVHKEYEPKASLFEKLLGKNVPKTTITYYMYLSNKSMLKATTSIKGYPSADDINSAKRHVALTLHDKYADMCSKSIH